MRKKKAKKNDKTKEELIQEIILNVSQMNEENKYTFFMFGTEYYFPKISKYLLDLAKDDCNIRPDRITSDGVIKGSIYSEDGAHEIAELIIDLKDMPIKDVEEFYNRTLEYL